MENIEISFDAETGKLTIEIDVTVDGEESSTGKSNLIANSGGWIRLGDHVEELTGFNIGPFIVNRKTGVEPYAFEAPKPKKTTKKATGKVKEIEEEEVAPRKKTVRKQRAA